MKNIEEQVDASRKSFDAVLHTPSYRQIHGDDDHLEGLLRLIDVDERASLLDLGTGDGYVAFEMAKRWPKRSIVGVDVASESILRDQNKTAELGIENAVFYVYEGIRLPFQNEEFDGVICRYVFHHCPAPQITVPEMSRVLKAQGIVVLSDPVPFPPDEGGFIDEFQRLKPDGHKQFYRKQVLDGMFDKCGFDLVDSFESSITYPREMDTRYEVLLDSTPVTIIDIYNIGVEKGIITITVKVMNTLYKKRV
jgi:ubiquinone/menaquinone biosynthesis C-methylase UbiE